MARIRSIKPGFFTSLDTAGALSREARLHFAGLWTYSDDEGRGVDDPRLIKAAVWPLEEDIDSVDVERLQSELHRAGRIVRYEVEGRRYFQVVNWHDHQKPNRPQKSKIPAFTDESQRFSEHSLSDHGAVTDDSSPEGRGVGGESNPPGETNGEPFARRLARELSAEHGVEIEPKGGLYEAFDALLRAALETLPDDRHHGLSMGLIADFVSRAQGLPITSEARSHTARLVRMHDPTKVLHGFGEALEWGAGTKREYATDPLSLTKYVAGVLKGGRNA
jgi:hypothetical protein